MVTCASELALPQLASADDCGLCACTVPVAGTPVVPLATRLGGEHGALSGFDVDVRAALSALPSVPRILSSFSASMVATLVGRTQGTHTNSLTQLWLPKMQPFHLTDSTEVPRWLNFEQL
jgi:hypothetical protein